MSTVRTTGETGAASLPFAILKPREVPARTHLYKVYPNPSPANYKDSSLIRQLQPFDNGKPVVVDLETEGLIPHGTEGKSKRVVTVSLANDTAVSSWNLRGEKGQQVWHQILNWLYKKQIPLIAHNLTFDLAWMLRDLNKDASGKLPEWINEFKFLKLEACTYGLLRQLASEGFHGQQYGLGWAQEHLLLRQESNKEERQRRLVEAGIFKRLPKKELLVKLLGPEDTERVIASFHIQVKEEGTEDEGC